MKQLLRFKTFLLMAVLSILAGTSAWAESDPFYTLDTTTEAARTSSNSYAGTGTVTLNGIEWTVKGNGQMSPWRLGGKSISNTDRTVNTNTAMGSAINKVVLTVGTASSITVNSLKLTVASDANFSNVLDEVTATFAASSDITFEPSTGTEWTTGAYYKFTFNVTVSVSSNKFVQFSGVKFYAPEGTSSNPSISADNVDIAYNATAGEIIYSVNNPATGGFLSASTTASWLTVGTVGETVPFTCDTNDGIERTATVTLTYTYGSESVSKNVLVTQAGNPNGPGTENNPYTVAQARAAIDAGSGTQGVYATGIVSEIITAYGYNNYSNITFNIVTQDGDSEFLQAFRCVSSTNADASTIAVGDIVVVSGNLTKYNTTYEFAQGCQVVSITHPAVSVEAPTFSPAAGTYADAQSVTISTATDGATVYYTTDGTEPTDASTPYTKEINISTTTTLKAIAYKGGESSTVATATYYICSAANPYTVTEALAFPEYPANGVYVQGIVSTAPTQTPTSNGQLTYYISVDGQATDQLQVYKGLGLNQATFTAQDDIQVGDEVTIYGNVKIYNSTKEFDTGNYLVAFNRPVVATPSITINIPNPADVNADGGDNEFEVTYTNLAADPQLAVVFCDANGDAVADGTYNWITATYNATSGKIDGHIDVNTGDARTAYFKVSGKDANDNIVYSELITINQSAYNPSINIKTEGAIEFDATGGSKTLGVDYESLGSNPTFELQFFEYDGTTETQCGWITYSFASNDNKVTITGLNNDEGAARTAYFKVYAEVNKTKIYSNLVTVNQAAPATDYADLPFSFDGGIADIGTTNGLTAENLGSDYGSSPKLKFNNDKQTISSLVLKINERPGTLTFDIKGNSFSGGTFKVQTSEDGTTYTDLETYTALGDKQSESFDNLGENVRYIKWIYTEKSSGNVALGNIALTKYVEPSNNPVINADNVNLAYNATSGEIAYTITNPVDGSNLNATTTAVWISNVTVESDKVTFATSANDGDERTAEVTLSYKGAADKVVTVTQAKYVAPATGDNYELYSGALVEGDYIIYYDGYAMNTTVTSDRLQYEEVTPVNDVITTDNAAIVWHIAPSSDYWTIYNADAKAYAASTGAKNKAQMLDDGTDDKALWTVSGTGTYEFVNKQNTTNSVNATLRLNSGYGFACYSDQTGGALTLYKKSSTPTPGTPSITLNQYVYNVNADGGNNELPVTCTNLAADPQLDVVFVESDGVTVATYGWIKATINANNNIAGSIDPNTGDARTAYLVVTGVDADNNVVKSNLVTINQAAPAAPSIVFDPASIDFDSNDGNRTIGGDYFACNDFASTPSLEILFYKSDGETPATYDWLMVGFNNEGKIDIAYDENTGAARSAYLKLHAEGTSVYSNLFTINQAAAADPNTIIFDFTTNDWGLPLTSENVSERREFKKDGYTIALTAGGNNKYGFNTDGYLLLGKNGATLEFPIFDFLVDKITIEGNTGASTSVKQAIYMKTYSEGLKQASSTTTGATGTNEYNISWGCQAAGEELLLQVTSAHNTQITRILIHKKETVDVTIGSTGYATLYYGDKNFSYGRKGGVSAYAVNLTNGALKMEAISNQAVIPAGTAMVLEGNPGTHVFEVEDAAFSSIAAEAEVNFTGCDNLLRGYDEPALTTGPDAGDYLFYLLGVDNGKVGFYWGKDNGAAFTSGAHKAYLAVPAEKAGGVRAFYFDDTTTGIDTLNLNVENENAYDLQGRRVQQLQKNGLYIVDGKKMLAK